MNDMCPRLYTKITVTYTKHYTYNLVNYQKANIYIAVLLNYIKEKQQRLFPESE